MKKYNKGVAAEDKGVSAADKGVSAADKGVSAADKELVLTGEFEEKDLRWFQEEGYTYCRPSNSFIGEGGGFGCFGSIKFK